MSVQKGKYTAFVVYSGWDDTYQKHAVCYEREAAQRLIEESGDSRWRVWEASFNSKRDLEDQVEDHMTDEQAALYLTESA